MADKSKDAKTFEERFLLPLHEELAKDAEVIRTRLEGDLLHISSVQSKWLVKYSKWKYVWITIDKQLKTIHAQKYKMALEGTLGFNVSKTEAKTLAGMDKDVIELETKKQNVESVLDFISSAQQIIRDKSFTIGNIIRLAEFEAGMG